MILSASDIIRDTSSATVGMSCINPVELLARVIMRVTEPRWHLLRRHGAYANVSRPSARTRSRCAQGASYPRAFMGHASSQLRQYLMTSHSSSIPMVGPSRTTTSASFWSISILHIALS